MTVIEQIDKPHVLKRIEDWSNRLEALFCDIDKWLLGSNRTIERKRHVRMYEELMQQFDIEAVTLPSAIVIENEKIILSLIPVGLWTIGANGRVDVFSSKQHCMLVDDADQFREPEWVLIDVANKGLERKFSKEVFLELLD